MIRRTLADWFSGRRPEPEREEIAADVAAERLAAVIAHAETWADRPPTSPYERGLRDAWRTILAIAKKGAE